MQSRTTVIFTIVFFVILCLSNCADETKTFYIKCAPGSLTTYSKVMINGFQVGNVVKVISKPTSKFAIAKIVLSDKNCITDSCVLVMSKRRLFDEYDIHVKRSNKGRCLTSNDTVPVSEEPVDLSRYIDTSAVLKLLDKTIEVLDTVRHRIKAK